FCEAGFSGKGKATAILTATCAIGGLVLFPALLGAAYETPGYSDRSKPLPREYALKSNALAPGTLATLTSPAFAEVKIDQPKFWEYTDVSSVNLYTGSVTVFLACAAI